jgi:hypothetical protein
MEADGAAEPVLKNVRLEVSTRLKIMWHNLLEMEDHVENPRDTSENTTRPNPAETIAMVLEQFRLSVQAVRVRTRFAFAMTEPVNHSSVSNTAATSSLNPASTLTSSVSPTLARLDMFVCQSQV